jgi:DNA-binding transcriptional MerR regulator
MRNGLFIGDLAKQVGMSTKTIRYYEDLGLLVAPARTETGYRTYGPQDADRLRFIQGAKALGLSLAEIKDVLGAWADGEPPCAHVSQRLDEKLEDLDRRIQELTAFRDRLRAYKAEVDAAGRDASTPCAHVAGANAGRLGVEVPAALAVAAGIPGGARPGKGHP